MWSRIKKGIWIARCVFTFLIARGWSYELVQKMLVSQISDVPKLEILSLGHWYMQPIHAVWKDQLDLYQVGFVPNFDILEIILHFCHAGMRRCWKIILICSFQSQAVQNNKTVKGFWCILLPNKIDVTKARTGRNREKRFLIHLMIISPELFSRTFCIEKFQSQTHFNSEISKHRSLRGEDNQCSPHFLLTCTWETLFQPET